MQSFVGGECFLKNGQVESLVNVVLPSTPPIGGTVTILHPYNNRSREHHGYLECEVLGVRMMEGSPNQYLTVREL